MNSLRGSEEEALTLRVAESPPKDVGRGIARLDPEDMARLGAAAGDVVAITGKRRTVALVMPAETVDGEQGFLHVSGIIRENAQAGIDERVEIGRVPRQVARSVVLVPSASAQAALRSGDERPRGRWFHKLPLLGRGRGRDLGETGRDSRYLGRLLDGIPLVTGDRLRVNLFGTRPLDFTISETTPEGAVVVDGSSRIRIIGKAGGASAARQCPMRISAVWARRSPVFAR